jgi:DedD protein
MAYDPQDDGFHEIQLSGKQLVFLFMATTVVSIVIFLCGVLVGRGVPRETEVSGMAADAGLQSAGDSGSPAAGQGGAAAGTSIPSPAETQPTSEEGLSYPERLADPQPPAEQVTPGTEAKPEVSEEPAAEEPALKEPAAADKAAPEPSDARPSGKGDEKAVSEPSEETASPSTPATLAKSAAEEPSKPAAAESSAESGSGSWTVQVAALSKRDEAEAVAKRLQSKGYLAFLVGPSGGGSTMYRVRVGNYKDRAEAERVMRRLAQEERLKPWITR